MIGTLTLLAALAAPQANERPTLDPLPNAKPRNIVFILSDDHRHDALGFLGHPFLETPNMDRMAREGVHFKNAFVTTSLCSPSRASILTGLYAHKHRVVDNNHKVSDDLVFFPQYLQSAGYQTAFVGKWHMGGESDAPQRGFDHWVAFRGQGTYAPERATLNVDGRRVPRKGYVTDELTDYALDWLKGREAEKPFFLYLSHKAVHHEFVPAERHAGRYKDAPYTPPDGGSHDDPGRPMWVKNQRNSWHGIEFPFHGALLDVAGLYRRYCETLLAIDESVGRVLDHLESEGLLDSTLVVYMGDNGFLFGEHGLIDKRCAYEESMRVPMLMLCPELFPGGTTVEKVVANIDLAPTLLEAAGLEPPGHMDGLSFLALPRGEGADDWRKELLYEYFWERDFPHTPTMHALRTDRYKFIRYHGLWDVDELFDLEADPGETRNLFLDPDGKPIADRLRKRLFEVLEQTDGMDLPMRPDSGGSQNLRDAHGSRAADFPPQFYRERPKPR